MKEEAGSKGNWFTVIGERFDHIFNGATTDLGCCLEDRDSGVAIVYRSGLLLKGGHETVVLMPLKPKWRELWPICVASCREDEKQN